MMKKASRKASKTLQTLSGSILIAGLVVLLIGAYYAIIKAGIPYQDAPDDILWIYEINMHIGDTLVKDGVIIFAAGLVFYLVMRAVRKSKNPGTRKNSLNALLILLFTGLAFAGLVLATRGIYAQIQGLPFEDPTQYGSGLAEYMWSRILHAGILLLVTGTLGCAIALIKKPNENNAATDDVEKSVIDMDTDVADQAVIDINADNAEQNSIERNTGMPVSSQPKARKIIGYILLGLLWSGFCFFVWINAVFYGNWHWTAEELIMHEPVTGRIVVFLANAMPILWIAVPAVIAIVLFVRKRKRSRNLQ